jgi:hypothetical protein
MAQRPGKYGRIGRRWCRPRKPSEDGLGRNFVSLAPAAPSGRPKAARGIAPGMGVGMRESPERAGQDRGCSGGVCGCWFVGYRVVTLTRFPLLGPSGYWAEGQWGECPHEPLGSARFQDSTGVGFTPGLEGVSFRSWRPTSSARQSRSWENSSKGLPQDTRSTS